MRLKTKKASELEIQDLKEKGFKLGLKKFIRKFGDSPESLASNLFRCTTYGIWLNSIPNEVEINWFGKKIYETEDGIYLPAMPNLAVNTGLHITAQRTFIPIAGGTLTPVANSTNDGIRYGGVDNSASAVAASTSEFDAGAGNRFITLFDSDPTYSTANKRTTAFFNITNTDTAIVHRRYGLSNSSSNADDSLFSMLSGFELNFNGKAYDITIESQSNWTGS